MIDWVLIVWSSLRIIPTIIPILITHILTATQSHVYLSINMNQSIFYGPSSPFSPLPSLGDGYRTGGGTDHKSGPEEGAVSEVCTLSSACVYHFECLYRSSFYIAIFTYIHITLVHTFIHLPVGVSNSGTNHWGGWSVHRCRKKRSIVTTNTRGRRYAITGKFANWRLYWCRGCFWWRESIDDEGIISNTIVA